MTAVQEIINHLETVEGAGVQVTTYAKSWLYEKKHVHLFKEGKDGAVLVLQGRKYVSLRGAKIRLGRWRVAKD